MSNLFDKAMAAGKAGAEYKADITDASIAGDELSFTSRITKQRQQQSDMKYGAITSLIEAGGAIHDSLKEKADFKQDLKNIEDSGKYGELQKDSRGFGQKLWDAVSGKSRQYTFADDTGKTTTFSKTGVTTQGTILSGGNAALSTGGVTGVLSDTAKQEHKEEQKQHYGKRKGFDLGDLWGEKSMTGLGKKKKEKISMAKESNMSDNEVKKEKKKEIQGPKQFIGPPKKEKFDFSKPLNQLTKEELEKFKKSGYFDKNSEHSPQRQYANMHRSLVGR